MDELNYKKKILLSVTDIIFLSLFHIAFCLVHIYVESYQYAIALMASLSEFIAAIICRDIGIPSFSKRFSNITVVCKNSVKPNSIKLFVRNLSILFFPIELMCVFCKKEHRGIMESLTETYLVSTRTEKTKFFSKEYILGWLKYFVWWIICSYLIYWGFLFESYLPYLP